MADFNIDNAAGSIVRAELNDNLGQIVGNSNGPTEPSPTFPHMTWVDTNPAIPELKLRNAADSAWITVGQLDPTNGFLITASTTFGRSQLNAADAAAVRALLGLGAAALYNVNLDASNFYTIGAGDLARRNEIAVWVDARIGLLSSSYSDANVQAWMQNSLAGNPGTYAFLQNFVTGSAIGPGAGVDGSSLLYANAASATGSPGGFWRLMGHINPAGGLPGRTSLWVRYA